MTGKKFALLTLLVVLVVGASFLIERPTKYTPPAVETKVVVEKVATDSGLFFISKDRSHTRVDAQDFMRFLVGDKYTTGWEK